MPDELTDTEIKKALEHIEAFTCCKDCAFYKKCKGKCVITATLDLINRQDFKIHQLEKQVSEIQNANLIDFKGTIGNYKAENENLKAEVERLKKETKKCKEHYKMACSERNEFLEQLQTAKAETYKEFADKLEKAFSKTESQMPNNEVVKQTVLICRNAIRLVLNRLAGV